MNELLPVVPAVGLVGQPALAPQRGEKGTRAPRLARTAVLARRCQLASGLGGVHAGLAANADILTSRAPAYRAPGVEGKREMESDRLSTKMGSDPIIPGFVFQCMK